MVPDGQESPKEPEMVRIEPGQIFKMVINASKWTRIPKMGRQGPRWTGLASRKMNRHGFFKRPGSSGFREIVPKMEPEIYERQKWFLTGCNLEDGCAWFHGMVNVQKDPLTIIDGTSVAVEPNVGWVPR
jgi:hypothetical protein